MNLTGTFHLSSVALPLLLLCSCVSYSSHSTDPYSGDMRLSNSWGLAMHPGSAPAFRESDADLQSKKLDELVEYKSTGQLRKWKASINSTLHTWVQGKKLSEEREILKTTIYYERKPVSFDWPLDGALKNVFAQPDEDALRVDYTVNIDIATIHYMPEGKNAFIHQFLLSMVTVYMYPFQGVRNRWNIRIEVLDNSKQTVCQRSLAIDNWYRFSLLFVFYPGTDPLPESRLLPEGAHPPFLDPAKMGSIAAYMIENCEYFQQEGTAGSHLNEPAPAASP